jgi:hypothetical protein
MILPISFSRTLATHSLTHPTWHSKQTRCSPTGHTGKGQFLSIVSFGALPRSYIRVVPSLVAPDFWSRRRSSAVLQFQIFMRVPPCICRECHTFFCRSQQALAVLHSSCFPPLADVPELVVSTNPSRERTLNSECSTFSQSASPRKFESTISGWLSLVGQVAI